MALKLAVIAGLLAGMGMHTWELWRADASHAVGDEALRCLGEILRSHCRLGDLAGRYGGEEFIMVFRSLEMRPAIEICERVRKGGEAWD